MKKKKKTIKSIKSFFRIDIKENSVIKKDITFIVKAKNITAAKAFVLYEYLGIKVNPLRKSEFESCYWQGASYINIKDRSSFYEEKFLLEIEEYCHVQRSKFQS